MKKIELTPRQLEIMTLIARGMTNKEIANQLRISHRTVEFHARRISEKAHISKRTALAIEFGIYNERFVEIPKYINQYK